MLLLLAALKLLLAALKLIKTTPVEDSRTGHPATPSKKTQLRLGFKIYLSKDISLHHSTVLVCVSLPICCAYVNKYVSIYMYGYSSLRNCTLELAQCQN